MRIFSKYTTVLLGVVLFAIVGTDAVANSVYSRHGIGLRRHFNGPLTIGMGGVGVAMMHPASLPYLNPAGMSFVQITRFDGSFRFENADINFRDEGGRLTTASFNSFQAAFPLKNGWAMGFGLQPVHDVAYRTSRERELEFTTASESIEGRGGLHRAFLHVGGRLGSFLAFGAGMNVYLGQIVKTWRVNYTSAAYRSTIDEQTSHIRGVGFFSGMVLRLTESLNAGAILYLPTELRAETTTNFVYFDLTQDDLVESREEIETRPKLPLIHGYGLQYRPNPRFMAGVDLVFSRWGEIAPAQSFGAVTKDTRRLAFGVAYTPSVRPLDSFFSRLTYSAGMKSDQLPYVDTDGSSVSETVFTAGLAIPFNLNRGRLDLGMEFGKRGSLSNNLVSERVFRFTAAITGGERWFIRRRR